MSSSADTKIGPSVWLVPYITLHSVLFWGGIVVLTMFRITAVQNWLHGEQSIPFLQEGLAYLNDWLLDHQAPWIAVALMTIGFFRSVILYLTAEYSTDEEALNVRYGFFCPGTSMISNVTNSLSFSMIIDINITQNPVQFLWGTGHLDVKMIDGEQVRLLCVGSPLQVKQQLLARSSADKIRLYAPVRVGHSG